MKLQYSLEHYHQRQLQTGDYAVTRVTGRKGCCLCLFTCSCIHKIHNIELLLMHTLINIVYSVSMILLLPCLCRCFLIWSRFFFSTHVCKHESTSFFMRTGLLPTHTYTWNPVSKTNTTNERRLTTLEYSFCVLTIGWIQISLADGSLGNRLECKVVLMTTLSDSA